MKAFCARCGREAPPAICYPSTYYCGSCRPFHLIPGGMAFQLPPAKEKPVPNPVVPVFGWDPRQGTAANLKFYTKLAIGAAAFFGVIGLQLAHQGVLKTWKRIRNR